MARRWYTHLRVAQAGHKRMVRRGVLRRAQVREYHPSMIVRHLRCTAALLTAGACLLLFATSARVTPTLSAVKSWAFQLQNVDPVEIKLSPYDLVVLDYGFERLNATAFPREIVDLMRLRPDGSRRLILAYLNIGEAEEARYYWRETWFNNRPDWLEPEDTDSPGVYRVKYWIPHGKRSSTALPRPTSIAYSMPASTECTSTAQTRSNIGNASGPGQRPKWST